MCLSAAEDMRELVAENHRLIAELNELRLQAGGRNTSPLEPKPLTEAMIQLMNVPNEVCGAFPAGYGDNWAFECHDVRPAQSNDSVVDRTACYPPMDDIPLAVSPTQDQVLNDHEITAMSASLAEYPLPTETLSQTSLNYSLSPETPADLSHTRSHEGLISDMAQIGCYMPFDMPEYPPVSLDTMPMDVSMALWMQDIGMSESAQSSLCGNTDTVGYVELEQIDT